MQQKRNAVVFSAFFSNSVPRFSSQVPWDPLLRELRSEAYLGLGNVVHAISDIRATTKLKSDDTEGKQEKYYHN